MTLYTVIESKVWRHTSGRTASIYGACPWTSQADKDNWQIENRGWTVRNNQENTVGIGRKPWETREEAEAWVEKEEARLAEYHRIRRGDN